MIAVSYLHDLWAAVGDVALGALALAAVVVLVVLGAAWEERRAMRRRR